MLKKNTLRLGILILLVLVVYHTRFFSLAMLTHGDRGYIPDLLNGHHAPFIWRNVMTLGDPLLDLGQWSWLMYERLGRIGVDYALAERLIYFWPSVLLASV